MILNEAFKCPDIGVTAVAVDADAMARENRARPGVIKTALVGGV